MEIISAEQIDDAIWDAFCDASPDAWTRHTSMGRETIIALDDEHIDCSFALIQGGIITAVIPLVSQPIADTSRREFAMGGMPVPMPAFAVSSSRNERKSMLVLCMKEIDRRAKEAGVVRTRMFVDPSSEPVLSGAMRSNPLQAFGYQDTSIATVSIDLAKDEKVLFDSISERRRRYISSAMREGAYKVEFFDCDTITPEVFAQLEELYESAAQRSIGTLSERRQTLSRIKRGYALLALVCAPGESAPRAGHFFSSYKQRSYDGFLAIRPEYKNDKALGSLMQWETIRFLKARGYTHYEIGWQFPPTISEEVYSPKELAISHFKALFGGELLPLFRGEKYYDMDYLREHRASLTESFIMQQGNQNNNQ